VGKDCGEASTIPTVNQVLDLEQWRALQGCDSAQYVWVMLTEIFAYRYQHVPIWCQFTERERRLIVQGFRILSERVCPYYHNGQVSDFGKSHGVDSASE
jgi:hypothetical protein